MRIMILSSRDDQERIGASFYYLFDDKIISFLEKDCEKGHDINVLLGEIIEEKHSVSSKVFQLVDVYTEEDWLDEDIEVEYDLGWPGITGVLPVKMETGYVYLVDCFGPLIILEVSLTME